MSYINPLLLKRGRRENSYPVAKLQTKTIAIKKKKRLQPVYIAGGERLHSAGRPVNEH